MMKFFRPWLCLKSIRILLAIVAFHDYEIRQKDVKTVFLNGNLEEDVYVTHPTGFEDSENAGKVCKLLKSIYGLKQASRSWNIRFNEEVKSLTSSDAKKNLVCTEKLVGVSFLF